MKAAITGAFLMIVSVSSTFLAQMDTTTTTKITVVSRDSIHSKPIRTDVNVISGDKVLKSHSNTQATPIQLSKKSSNESIPTINAELKPATRTQSSQADVTAKYELNQSLSDLDNLINMIALKKKVNESDKFERIATTTDYQNLNANIAIYKSKFNNYVVNKGIKNCSIKEQSYYLSFLKEEGKMVEYEQNYSLIKSDN